MQVALSTSILIINALVRVFFAHAFCDSSAALCARYSAFIVTNSTNALCHRTFPEKKLREMASLACLQRIRHAALFSAPHAELERTPAK